MDFANRRFQHTEKSTGGNMKQQSAMVGTQLPKSLVKELKRIEEAEHTDRSTTVRNLLQNDVVQFQIFCFVRTAREIERLL
jgi:hypothetical protein